jgi:predicted CopG family antitoxin
MCSHESKKIFYHEWIGFKKKKGEGKVSKFLAEIYPMRKTDELELLAVMMTKKDVKYLAEQHGYTDKEISKITG